MAEGLANERGPSPTRQNSNILPPSSKYVEEAIFGWRWPDITEWLSEQGLSNHAQRLLNHKVCSGKALLRVTEEHLKEIGFVVVGERLEMLDAIDRLRARAGVSRLGAFVDAPSLLEQLDLLRAEKELKLLPKRIILIRHAQSEGNVDPAMYASVPDSKLRITEQGKKQAYAAGVQLKDVIGQETVTFYVSPFLRSAQTYQEIRLAFTDEQVVWHREDPRLREQEWGNFQDPQVMKQAMEHRRKVGAFYYRFPTGESGADVFDRVSMFLETLYRDMHRGLCGQNTIILSHGLFCRVFLTRFFRWSIEKFHKLWNFDNCQYSIMELQPDKYYKLITELKCDP